MSGALLDYGRTVYQPSADLRDFIPDRDPVCIPLMPAAGPAVTLTHPEWGSWTSPAGKVYLVPPAACGPPVDRRIPAGAAPPPRGGVTS